MAMVNHYYFYVYDHEWGPAFINTNAYAPWPVWLRVNGHEWAKQQLFRVYVRAGCDAEGVARADGLGGGQSPFPPRCEGVRHDGQHA